eukprot:COSAG05_NODE_3058_length_2374_cov_1.291868_2_plen_38_part_00
MVSLIACLYSGVLSAFLSYQLDLYWQSLAQAQRYIRR